MMLQIIIYTIFFIIGVTLGSFFTLATYRIPLKQDITHTRSYCPKCNNKLKFKDLIPILSYIFLKGKCRYCKEKISPRYIIIEFFSGVFYLLFVLSLKINWFNITPNNIESLFFGTLIISTFFILGGIARESKTIFSGVLTFGVVAQIIHMIYLYVFKNNIYRYIIYTTVLMFLYIISIVIKEKENKIYIKLLIAFLFSIIATNEIVFFASISAAIILYLLKYKKQKNIENVIFYFCFSNILFLILYNFLLV